eukprot:Phypoly_transcript_03870.p1 GENE.Phypoly_transcript_03870~~Phypoly_transcript_03870.p1  ORF type:complete len:620 (+),score=77.65 Phypoly_transcript_03870:439-2298(+)
MRGPHRQGVRHLSFTKSGTHCASSSNDMLVIWKCGATIHDPFVRLKMLDLSSVPHSLLQGAYISTGGEINNVAVCMQDGSISLWRGYDMQLLHEQPAPPIPSETLPPSYFSSLAISSSSTHLVLSGNAPVLYVYKIEMNNSSCSINFSHYICLDGSVNYIVDVVFLPPIIKTQGYWVVTLADDGIIRFIDLFAHSPGSEVLLEISPPPRDVFSSFALSSHGRYLAASTQKGSVYLYDVFSSFHQFNMPTNEFQQMELSQSTKSTTKCHPKVKSAGSATKSSPNKPQPTHPHPTPTSNLYPVPVLDESTFFSPKGLSHEKILALLRTYGEYPSKYRTIIWKSLLRLPENNEAYANLLRLGTHFAYTNLHNTLPIKNRRLYKKMERNLSLLVHWAPIFGEVQYLPELIFPFVKLINDDLLCFEIICTFLVNWCDEWFEFYPHPPVVVLQQIDTLLEIHDPHLVGHFYSLGLSSADYIYPLLTTLLSEVLRTEEWQILFDHLCSNPTSFLAFIVVAFLKYFRSALLKSSREDLEFFLHHINANDIHHILRLAYKTRIQTNLSDIPDTKPFQALPRGHYPIFHKVPKRRFEHQAQQIEQIRKQEEVYLAKKRAEVLHTVQTRM